MTGSALDDAALDDSALDGAATGMTTPPRRRAPSARAMGVLLAAAAGLAIAFVALIAARVGPLTVTAPPYRPEAPKVVITASPPPPMPTFDMQDLQDQPNGDWLWWVGLVLGGLIAVVLALWLLRALRDWFRRPARPVVAGAGAGVEPTVWSHLAEPSTVDLGDPRTFHAGRSADDIIASWDIVEAAARALGDPRRDSSTPTEFLSEITADLGDPVFDRRSESGPRGYDAVLAEVAAAGRTTAGGVLLHFYHRARFDTAALAPGAASAARRAARQLLDSWDLSRRQRAEPFDDGQARP